MFPALGFLFGAFAKTIIAHLEGKVRSTMQAAFIQNAPKVLDENDQRSFIDAFLIQQKEEKTKNQSSGFFHNENLKAVVNDLFGAGTETTSTTLRWGLLLMMKYPEIQSYGPEVCHGATGSLPSVVMSHTSSRPHPEFGVRGTHIVPLLYSVLYDESQWENPFQFYPEHFLDSEGKFVKRDAFLPFSAGRRVCAGETLAKMELFLFFVSLLQRFTFQPAPGTSKEDLDLTPDVGSTWPPMPYHTCALPR
uniref:Uncharacterized protein n=1 Tax=Sphaerodactylus townsendi TaxID=933632 RepID=A0ACB8GEX2_9SAUR